MSLYGFCVNHENGSTDYVLVVADHYSSALLTVESAFEGYGLESITLADPSAIVEYQYNGLAILTTEHSGTVCDG